MRKYDLEDRLIDYAVLIIDIAEALPKTDVGRYLTGQIIRSGTSPALNYGEAQSAESRKDFIHKMKIGLKELRETCINLRIIQRKAYSSVSNKLEQTLDEGNELISIFVKSIQTARKNDERQTSNIE
jgi:four helix bundle protein